MGGGQDKSKLDGVGNKYAFPAGNVVEKRAKEIESRGVDPASEEDKGCPNIDTPEAVDHPSHYNPEGCKIETIDFIEDREHLGFKRLNAIKYIDRSGAKVGESKGQSIRKAIWYLERELGMHRKGDL